jgi:hypothetical protein
MTKVVVTVEFHVDVDNLGSEYGNDDYLTNEVCEHISYALYRFDAADINFTRVDIEGT